MISRVFVTLCLIGISHGSQAFVIFEESERGPWIVIYGRGPQVLSETCTTATLAKPGCSGKKNPFAVGIDTYTIRLYRLFGVGDEYATADGLARVNRKIEGVERDLSGELSETKHQRALNQLEELRKKLALIENAHQSILNPVLSNEGEEFDGTYEFAEIERTILALHPIWADGDIVWRYCGVLTGEQAKSLTSERWLLPGETSWTERIRKSLLSIEFAELLKNDLVIWGDKYQPESWYITSHSKHYNASRGEYVTSFPRFLPSREAAEEAFAAIMRGTQYTSVSYTGPDRQGSRLSLLVPSSQRQNSESAEGPRHHTFVTKKLVPQD